MSKEFKIVHESEIDGTPDKVFFAATEGQSGWMWPMPGEFEPRVGGAGPMGSTVTVWDPPHHFANHMEGPNGFFNDLEFEITERPGGKSWLRYVHSGIIFEDWDNQYDGASKHTTFYVHTLGQYVKHFARKQAAFADVQGPAESGAPDAFERVKAALGIDDAVGRVPLAIPGLGVDSAEVDFVNENFLGLRTKNGMYRFFGRNAFGSVVGITVHLFNDDADAQAEGAAWGAWLNGVFA